jgi:methylthioribose-1-phosphate isomerase
VRVRVDGKFCRTIQKSADGHSIEIIDQTRLPHCFEIATLTRFEEAATAIAGMRVRGAPLIGVTAAYGVALAMRDDPSDANLEVACATLAATRPTAVNLCWALGEMRRALTDVPVSSRATVAFTRADAIAEQDVELCSAIGDHGLELLRAIAARKPSATVEILTHCNAGWLATVDWGTATAPIFKAHDAGIPVHVWVEETRPRNQGALTAWELGQHGVPHTFIVDNAGGHLMQRGKVDLVIVGTDRTTAEGDVCNKIGTYLKALSAADNGVPFYVAAPSPSIDFALSNGISEVPIEHRTPREVTHVTGRNADGATVSVAVTPSGSAALNPAFDVTPARLVTALVTERGVIPASRTALAAAFPERMVQARAG